MIPGRRRQGARPAPAPTPSEKPQYERFLETARGLGVDDKKSGEAFERAFEEIVPPRKVR